MSSSRIKNIELALQITTGELEWLRFLSPISEHYIQQISQKDYHGKRVAYWGHLTRQTIVTFVAAFEKTGVELALGACNVDSTDDAAAAYAVSKGFAVYGWRGMSQQDYQENLRLVRDFEADVLCDMGGELSLAYLDKTPPVKGALEATTSGLHRLDNVSVPFPIFNWNDIPLKALHNRFHVGDTVWPAFNTLTGMSLYGRKVLVIGCGPVGKGIAERARAMEAIVLVTDLDPVRMLEARHLGCETVSLEEGLGRADIIVTATGFEGVLGGEQLRKVKPGAVLFNAGHSNREIDIDWLYRQPHKQLRPQIELFEPGKTHLYLLGRGSLLNLSAGTGPYGLDQFDHYDAIMLRGISWMLDGMPETIQPGLQRFPLQLEQEIASLSLRISTGKG